MYWGTLSLLALLGNLEVMKKEAVTCRWWWWFLNDDVKGESLFKTKFSVGFKPSYRYTSLIFQPTQGLSKQLSEEAKARPERAEFVE